MRKIAIAGNWKMHKLLSEASTFIEEVKAQVPSADQVCTIICAPFPFLPALVEKAKGTPIQIAAQNMHQAASGAFTGEVSAAMLKDIGVDYCIIGHSERREYFAETDGTVNEKVHAAFENGITPIVCVGETLAQREAGETETHIASQVTKALAGLDAVQIAQTIVAYEPIWAIGTGKTATSEEANTVCRHIRQTVSQLAGQTAADQLLIQYGGSVKPANIASLLSQSDIDGALVGGASLEPDSFVELTKAGIK